MATNLSVYQSAGLPAERALRYFFPNKMGRIALLAMEEVMGRNGVNVILNLARLHHRIGNYPPDNFDQEFAFEELAQLLAALDEMYGTRGGRGLARRAGHACFKLGIKDFAPLLGIADLAFRVMPLGMRIRVSLEILAQIFNRFTDHLVRWGEDEQYYYWITERCGACWGRRSNTPCCHLTVGLLEEGLYWISGGKRFYVEEVSCIAAGGSSCTILMSRNPLD